MGWIHKRILRPERTKNDPEKWIHKRILRPEREKTTPREVDPQAKFETRKKKKSREYFFFSPSNLFKIVLFSLVYFFSSPGPFFKSPEKNSFPPNPQKPSSKPNFFPGEFFVDFFFTGPAQKKKSSPGTNSAARVGGCRARFEFFSWVLPGGPPFRGAFFSLGRKSKFCTVVKKMR